MRTQKILVALLIVGMTVTGCAATPAAPKPITKPTTAAYAVPAACPSAAKFRKARGGILRQDTAIDAKLLDAELSKALPEGGCAYVVSDPKPTTDPAFIDRNIEVWYFNLDTPGRNTSKSMFAWATSVGATPEVGTDAASKIVDAGGNFLDLPSGFSRYSGATAGVVDGKSTQFPWNESVMPAYTKSAQAKIAFSIDSSKADAMIAAAGSGTTGTGTDAADPTSALAHGLNATFKTNFDMASDAGYTALAHVEGKLQPFTSSIINAAPGSFDASFGWTVGGSITNTTPGRNTAVSYVQVIALYAKDSVACKYNTGVFDKGAANSNSSPSYCFYPLGGLQNASLAPGASQDFPPSNNEVTFGTFQESSDALKQLNAPLSVYAYFGGNASGSSGVSWHSDKGCQSKFESGDAWFVAMEGWPDILCR